MPIDKRLKGEQNKLAVLTNLQRFGWLTAPMLTALVWPASQQGQTMARRTLAAMLDAKLVLKRPLLEAMDCFTLSAAGARTLTEQTGIRASSGASLLLGNVVHRACSNWFLIEKINSGLKVWTEHEIQSGHAPMQRVNGKVADGLVMTEFGLLWIEVENAWKNRAEREKVRTFCAQHLPPSSLQNMQELAQGHFLFRVVVVGTSPQALQAMVRTFAQAYEAGQLTESQAADVDLVYLPLSARLTAEQAVRGNLWYDALNLRSH